MLQVINKHIMDKYHLTVTICKSYRESTTLKQDKTKKH